MPKIDMRDNISNIYELKKKEECGYAAVGIYCNCQMKALNPLFETFILFGLAANRRFEGNPPAQYALAYSAIPLWRNVAKIWRNSAKRQKSIAKSRLIRVICGI